MRFMLKPGIDDVGPEHFDRIGSSTDSFRNIDDNGLAALMSYDEIGLAELLSTCTPTFFINDEGRN